MPYTLDQARERYGWLGRVVAVHEIGRYSLVEYVQKDDGASAFAGVIDGRSTSNSYETLEEAIVGCIAITVEGFNTRADRYFFRMMEPEAKPSFPKAEAA